MVDISMHSLSFPFSVRLKLSTLALLTLVSACGNRELILPGEREPVRPVVEFEEAETLPALSIPAQRANTDWTHLSGNSLHLPGNVALSANLSRGWSVSIGSGDSRRKRITSAPIVAAGRIFTMDSTSTATAVDLNGRVLWSTSLTREGENAPEGFGGGLAAFDTALVVSTGFGEVLRLDPGTGQILWRTAVDGAIRAAPAVAEGRVVVVARSDIAYGLDLETGTLDWRVQGAGLGAGLLGGASPAIRGPVTIIPFKSGEVVAVLTKSGRRVWSAAVTGGRRELVRSKINDISGNPVIDNDIVYAANQSGRLVQLDRRSGERLWTHRDGSYGPALPVGNSVFFISDIGTLTRIDAETGETIWQRDLPEWARPRKRRNAIPHFGPLLAGGRLLIASGDGLLRSFDPATGAELSTVQMGAGASSSPAIANGVLYVVTRNGQLHAFQ